MRNQTKVRYEFIDIMKGIGILLVIIGHVSNNSIINKIIYSFHMPMFFFISGFICYRKGQKELVSKKINSLIKPYFIFAILSFIYWILIERKIRGESVSIVNQFIGIFIANGGPENYVYNIVLWFLPCLFITEVIFNFLLNKYDNIKDIFKIIIIFFVIGVLIKQFNIIRLPWSFDTMITSIQFYGCGYIVKVMNNEGKLNNIKKRKNIVLLLVTFIGVVLGNINGNVDMNNNKYSIYIVYFLVAYCGIVFIWLISSGIKNKFISYLGVNSLIIMCTHEPLKRIVIKIVSILSNNSIEVVRNNLIYIFIISLLILCISIPIITIINKYFSFIIGKANCNILK